MANVYFGTAGTSGLGYIEGIELNEKYGIEAEYMIVDKNSLKVLPIADKLFYDMKKENVLEVDLGYISLSNELVKHLVEIKVSNPKESLFEVRKEFRKTVNILNNRLKNFDAILLSTSMHPFMDVEKETVLWQDDNKEIYEAHDRIFCCKGHGWSNLQSVHINLPFFDDDEF